MKNMQQLMARLYKHFAKAEKKFSLPSKTKCLMYTAFLNGTVDICMPYIYICQSTTYAQFTNNKIDKNKKKLYTHFIIQMTFHFSQ